MPNDGCIHSLWFSRVVVTKCLNLDVDHSAVTGKMSANCEPSVVRRQGATGSLWKTSYPELDNYLLFPSLGSLLVLSVVLRTSRERSSAEGRSRRTRNSSSQVIIRLLLCVLGYLE